MDKEKELNLAHKVQGLIAEIIYKYHRIFDSLPEDVLQSLDRGSISLWTLDRFFKDEGLAEQIIHNTASLQQPGRLEQLAEILLQLFEERLQIKYEDTESSEFAEEWISSILSFYSSKIWAKIAPKTRLKRQADLLNFLTRSPKMRVYAERYLTPIDLAEIIESPKSFGENERQRLEKIVVEAEPIALPKPSDFLSEDQLNAADSKNIADLMYKLYPGRSLYDRLGRASFKYFWLGETVGGILESF